MMGSVRRRLIFRRVDDFSVLVQIIEHPRWMVIHRKVIAVQLDSQVSAACSLDGPEILLVSVPDSHATLGRYASRSSD